MTKKRTVLAEDDRATFIRKGADGNVENLPTADGAQGVMFSCPEGDVRHEHFPHTYLIWFENPINAEKVLPQEGMYPRWKRTGDTLETLTLSPSIRDVTPDGCHWHGFVKNGVAE